MKSKKLLSIISFSILGATALSLGLSLTSSPSKSIEVKATSEVNKDYPYVDDSLPSTDTDSLYITMQNITKTTSGESFMFRFAANTVLFPIGTTGTNAYKETTGVYVSPNDDNYPADKQLSDLIKYDVDINNITKDSHVKRDSEGKVIYENGLPVCEDGYGYTYDRPTYNAVVARIDTTNSTKKGINTIVIPYSVSYGSWFDLRVTKIGEDVIYNSTVGISKYDGVNTVIIGENIEEIPANAFTAADGILTVKSVNKDLPETWNLNFTDGDVEFGYVPTSHEKEIFDTSEKKDKDGNVIYYDKFGAVIDSEGYYHEADGSYVYLKDEQGNYILDDQGNKIKKHYDETPLTTFAAFRFQAGSKKDLASKNTFLVGNIDEAKGINLPLLLKFDVRREDGTTYNRIFECPLDDPESFPYDAVGADAGMYAISKIIDIRLNPGEDIDYESMKLYNIFEAEIVRDEKGTIVEIKANTNHAYKGIPVIGITRKNNFEDFFNIRYDSVKTIFGYTAISLKFDCVEGAYQQVKEKKYLEKEAGIKDGTYKIRYSIRGFNSAYYKIYDSDGKSRDISFDDSVRGGIPGELDYHVFDRMENNTVTFLLEDSCIGNGFSYSNLNKIEICAFNVGMDICPTKKGTTQVVTQSSITFRFGYLDILPTDLNTIGHFDGNLFLIIFSCSFLALFLLGTFGYYFYAKNRFKNDEFRRMNTKAYAKRMAVGFIGAFFLAGAIAFIYLRFGQVNPTIIVYNPLDPLVIIFGVGGLISLGFFIRFLVIVIRQEKTRRKNIKLKLDEDVADDGTK